MEKRYAVFFFVAIILLNFLIFYKIFTSVAYALVVAYFLLPLNDFFERIVKNRGTASFITVLVILVPVVVILFTTFNTVVSDVLTILRKPELFVDRISAFESYLMNYGIEISFSSEISRFIKEIAGSINIKTTFDLLKDISYVTIDFLLFLFSAFYLLKDGRKLKKAIDTFIPVEIKGGYHKLTHELDNALQGLFYGYVLTAAIMGVVGGMIFYILGTSFDVSYLVNYSVLLGFLIFLFGLLPILGAPMIYGPIVLVELFTRPLLALIILILGLIVLTYLPAFVLTPYIAEKKSEIHPLIILFGFVAGPIAFGPSGFVLGPVLLCSLVALYRVKTNEN